MIDFKSDSKNKHNTVINYNEKILTEKLNKHVYKLVTWNFNTFTSV